MTDWSKKLEELKEQHNSTAEQLADMLGITTRTLATLMKEGSEPTKPIQRLIDNLLNSNSLSSERSKPHLNLILIHPGFKVSKDDSENTVDKVISTLMALNTETSRISAITDPRQSELFRNEYHYIATPDDKETQNLHSALQKKKVLPHYLYAEIETDTKKTLDVFFTATAIKLVLKALNQKLAHVTIAADIEIFWSLGREIRENHQDVGVTFVRQYGMLETESLKNTIASDGCQIIDPPLGRCSGKVTYIHPNGSFGFIEGESTPNKSLFFSWNHMKRNDAGFPEIDIQQLKLEDRVSYTIGVNDKGPCATNVALIGRGEYKEGTEFSQKQNLTPDEINSLKKVLADAINICADRDGWALLANVGTRIKLMFPDKTEILSRKGYKWQQFVKEHPETFDHSADGRNTSHSAACVRLKKTSKA